jgi:hypothetical protein
VTFRIQFDDSSATINWTMDILSGLLLVSSLRVGDIVLAAAKI